MKKLNSKKIYSKNNKGFLLVELIVALFIFSLFVTISIGSIISLLDANRKTQSLKSVMNNLNLALDNMTRDIAVGREYDCGFPGGATDCSFSTGGDRMISFLSNEDLNNDGEMNDRITYEFAPAGPENPVGYIHKSISTAFMGEPVRMTSYEVNITNVNFFVDGTAPFNENPPHDINQPRVVIWIDGVTETAPRGTASSFHVQTSVTQRVPDNIVNEP